MAQPHPALLALAAGQPLPSINDHAALVASALDHAMGGLLWSVVRAEHDGWPDACRRELATRDLVVRQHHQRLWHTLSWLSETFDALSVDAATIKGVTCEARWYDREGERPSVDVDVLLAPYERKHIDEVIAAIQPAHPLAGEACRLVAAGRLQSVELRAGGVAIDLHVDPWKLWIPTRVYDEVWATTRIQSLDAGRNVRVLGPDAALLQLLLHMHKDNFRRLLGYVDIARVIQREDVDWATVERLADRDGVAQQVAFGLAAVGEVIGIGSCVPSIGTRGRARCRALEATWPRDMRLAGESSIGRRRWRQYWVALLARGRAAEGIASLGRRVLPDPALVRYRHADVPGSYARRLLVGRVRGFRNRRRALAQGNAGENPFPSGRTNVR